MNFNIILRRIANVLTAELGLEKITLTDISKELGISIGTLYSKKSRDSIPHKQILEFCAKRKILANWIYFGQHAEDIAFATYLVAPRYAQVNSTQQRPL